jgi:ribonucleoside-diphosphate reductase alpha chain
VAIYRDGSKRSQPLNTKRTNEGAAGVSPADQEQVKTLEARIKELETETSKLREQAGMPLRRRLPETRHAVNHKFDIAGHEGYLTVGLFEDGQPGELFITMAKEGSTIGGLMDSVATLTSMALQYGVPLEALVKKFSHQRFEPSGFTKHPGIRQASSIIDYVFRWMALQFLPGYFEATSPNQPDLALPGLIEEERKHVNRPVPELPLAEEDTDFLNKPEVQKKSGNGHSGGKTVGNLSGTIEHLMKDAPLCPKCGHIAVRNGACFKCLNCGESLGCS